MSDAAAANTPIDQLANLLALRVAATDPILATHAGITELNDKLTDFSPAGLDAKAAVGRETLAQLDGLTEENDADRVTAATLRERLGVHGAIHDAGRTVGELNVIASPMQDIRDVFDLTPSGTPDEIATLTARLEAVPSAVDSAVEGLRVRLADGAWPFAELQVREVLEQARKAGDQVAANVDRLGEQAPSDLKDRVRAAFAGYADVLETEVLPAAKALDEPGGLGVGRDVYPLYSRLYLGADVDLEETYAWGQELLAGIVAEQQQVAHRLYPGATVSEALARLDTEPRYTIHGTAALQEWMQRTSDEAVAALAGTHFDIPAELHRLDCKIAPSNSGGIYYTGPSADLSRAGAMWWSVPDGVTEFHTWQEKTTVYHEGVPGHHLQIGQSVIAPLNVFRKLASFVSGHGEGWALYAERLMRDLGFLDDDGDLMGMLDSQRLRASRVVLDIGVHCGFEAPAEVGGGAWTYEKGWRFLRSHVAMSDEQLRFEYHRYLGWPGQAPSYSVGQRVWEQTRDAYLAAHPGSTLKDFHRDALALGGMGLDTLRAAIVE
ncbi:Bacterial protein of uncharacterised function (DUF885) (plasmid) [Tsukamurella tyrosinosolvens]|uniref:Uncharacterized conserved protein, DUF885 familyt n=1 Tax=Tsukamurella tyrosinosolvens TaxID=57704 RepID=A0A1H4SU20_TSUTY|nr:DUF885 domain-containing protein [Tsukamurella tyrosinosolvens]KXO93378.1 hypothetical protein AXK58_16180 [Tsukamurella tyrosinosolvens]SEC47606.1 Uncharacterized conserved protein, DUF885 familyt [Tsukamurella tyrosinosolvens]VEH98986.1 Bacterial protein of uncharacterised function (DUF885) [Tsukamurella tyrosinosolvens]